MEAWFASLRADLLVQAEEKVKKPLGRDSDAEFVVWKACWKSLGRQTHRRLQQMAR